MKCPKCGADYVPNGILGHSYSCGSVVHDDGTLLSGSECSYRCRISELEQENFGLSAQLAIVSKVCRSVVNELKGTLGAFEMDLRTVMGNTNFHCLEQRRDQLDAILSTILPAEEETE